MIQNLQKTK